MEKRKNAFALIELVVIIAMIVLLIGLLLPAMGQAKRSAFNVVSINNLNALNAGSGQYAADNAGRIFSYTWRGGVSYKIPGSVARSGIDDIDAAALQNMEILMRSTGRASGATRIIKLRGRPPHRRYSHTVLLDYLAGVMAHPVVTSPFDTNLIKWQSEPLSFLKNLESSGLPYANGFEAGYDDDPRWADISVTQRWTFGSSYHAVPAAYTGDGIGSENVYVPVASTPHQFMFRGGKGEFIIGNRQYTQVAYPSQKVHMFEEFDRFTDRDGLYFAYPEAKPNLAFFDGSVRSESSSDSNPGWNPDAPGEEWRQRYIPLDTFPIPRDGLGSDSEFCQRFRWTRHGLQGIDFGGKDVGRRLYGLPREVIGGCEVE